MMKKQIALLIGLAVTLFSHQLVLNASGTIVYLEDNRYFSYSDSYSGVHESGGSPVPFEDWKGMRCRSDYMSAGLEAVSSSYYDEFEGEVYHYRSTSFDVSFRLVQSMDVLFSGDGWASWDGGGGIALSQGSTTLLSIDILPDQSTEFNESVRLGPGEYRLQASPFENADMGFRADFVAVPEPATGSLIIMTLGIFGLRKARLKRGIVKVKIARLRPVERHPGQF